MVPPLRALPVGLLLLLTACRVPCEADEKPTPAQLAREQKAMYRGQPICRQLLAPEITVRDHDVVVRAVKESTLADAELAPRLALYREHFRAVRAGEPFDATATFHLPPAAPGPRVLALLSAAAGAGISRLHLDAGGASAEVTLARDAPPLAGATAADIVRAAAGAGRASLVR